MKNLLLLSFLLGGIMLFNACGEKNIKEGFTYEPEKPRPGDAVTIYYKPTDPRFMDADSLECRYYLAKGNDPILFMKQLEKNKDYFTTVVETDEETRLVYLHVLNMELDYSERNDNNDSSGYQIILYDKNGSQVAGTLAEMGLLKSSYHRIMRTEENIAKAFELFCEEFKINPDMKSNYIDKYLFLASKYNGVNEDSLIENELTAIVSKDVFTESEYRAINEYYKEEDKQEIIEKIGSYFEEHHPKSEVLRDIQEAEIAALPDINDKLTRYAAFVEKYPESNPLLLNYTILKQLKNETNEEKVAQFLESYQKYIRHYQFFEYARSLTSKGTKLELANKLISMAIEKVENTGQDNFKQPTYETDSEFKSFQMNYYLPFYFDTKGIIFTKFGKYDEALTFMEKAFKYSQGRHTYSNERYVDLLIKTEQYETALDKAKEFYNAGQTTDRMMSLIGEAYIKVHGSDEGLIKFTEELKLTNEQKLLNKLKEEWLDIPAPSFTLIDRDGNQVSLSDYKGKIVVLDFWATTCAPCIGSFPGMKRVVDSYKDDNDVAFLFINSFERSENPIEYVSQFMEKKGYSFYVLFDLQNTVCEQYKIDFFPTKIVIDPDGIIRFKAVGFDGSTDEIVSNLSGMIELVKEKS